MKRQVKTYGDIVADPDYFALFEDLIKAEGDRPGRVGVGVLAARNIQHFTPDNVKYWEELHDFAVEQMFLLITSWNSLSKFCMVSIPSCKQLALRC